MSAINARCGASMQTIADGDVCRVLLLSQASSYSPITVEMNGKQTQAMGIGNTSAYLNCLWRPEGPFLRAVYDDYGMSQLVLDSELDRSRAVTQFAELYRTAALTLAGKNQYHDTAFDLPTFMRTNAPRLAEMFAKQTWYSPPVFVKPGDTSYDSELQVCWTHLCDQVRRHRVFGQGFSNYLRPYSMFIVHERAFQLLLTSMTGRKDWDGNSWAMEAFLYRGIEHARRQSQEWTPAEDTPPERVAPLRTAFFSQSLGDFIDRYDVDGSFSDSTSRYAVRKLAGELADCKLSDEAFVAQATPWAQDRMALCALETMSIRLSPVTYVGADRTNASGLAYSDFIAEVSSLVTEQRKAKAA